MGGDSLTPPRILVCGGRDYNNKERLFGFLDDLCTDRGWNTPKDEYGNCLPHVIVIGGKARGADTLGADWALTNWCGLKEFPADWDQYGKRAGYIRNQQMLDEGKPDVVVAAPGGRGTEMMISLANKAGVEVVRVPNE